MITTTTPDIGGGPAPGAARRTATATGPDAPAPHAQSRPEVLATAKAQRWDPAEVLRVLLAEEVAGRERSALATRRTAAGFPTGKTFDAWDPEASSIPAPTQQALRTLEWVHRRRTWSSADPRAPEDVPARSLGPASRRSRVARRLVTPGRPRRAPAPAPRRRHRRQSHRPHPAESRTRHR